MKCQFLLNNRIFFQAGPLTKVMICEDKEGKTKSFGYVCFKHKVSVPYAKALLDGIRLYGRPITVQYWRGMFCSPNGLYFLRTVWNSKALYKDNNL